MTNVHTSHITLNFRVPRPNGLLVEEEPASREASSPDRERPLDGQGDTQATASDAQKMPHSKKEERVTDRAWQAFEDL